MENNTLRAKAALRGMCVAAVMMERLMDRELWGSYESMRVIGWVIMTVGHCISIPL